MPTQDTADSEFEGESQNKAQTSLLRDIYVMGVKQSVKCTRCRRQNVQLRKTLSPAIAFNSVMDAGLNAGGRKGPWDLCRCEAVNGGSPLASAIFV